MPIELRSWINPQSYSNSYSTAPIARTKTTLYRPAPGSQAGHHYETTAQLRTEEIFSHLSLRQAVTTRSEREGARR